MRLTRAKSGLAVSATLLFAMRCAAWRTGRYSNPALGSKERIRRMSQSNLSLDERTCARLRSEIAEMELRLAQLRDAQTTKAGELAADGVTASWRSVVASLALADDPPRRRCPSCQHMIQRAATRCLHCWNKSPPE
jgi:hypothetical protein